MIFVEVFFALALAQILKYRISKAADWFNSKYDGLYRKFPKILPH